jgi:hypothetical protein
MKKLDDEIVFDAVKSLRIVKNEKVKSRRLLRVDSTPLTTMKRRNLSSLCQLLPQMDRTLLPRHT